MPQSIYIQNIETLRDEFEKKSNCNSNKLRLKKRFEVGEEVSIHEFIHTYLYRKALENNECVLVNLIQEKLHKTTETKYYDKPKTISYLIEEISEKNSCTIEETCESINQEW